MAKFFPPFKDIHKLPTTPTNGEKYFLNFLKDNLNNNFEIYFQSNINGDRPDIVIVRPTTGVLIVEVKDWNLQNYTFKDDDTWVVYPSDGKAYEVMSPFCQVMKYKDNLTNLYIPELTEKVVFEKKAYAVIATMVYFHCASTEEVRKNFAPKKDYTYTFYAGNNITKDDFDSILEKSYLTRKTSKFFSRSIYIYLRRLLQPDDYTKNSVKEIHYSSKQQEIINAFSCQKAKMKILGCAGSGKSQIIARIALNETKQNKQVVILTFNITLRNYIRDLLSKASTKAERRYIKKIEISHYHHFLLNYLNNNNIPHPKYSLEFFDTKINFKPYQSRIRYDVILIDEVQDYKKNWIINIREALSQNGKICFLGDINQNIYARKLEKNNRPYTGISGEWKKINESHRVLSRVSEIAAEFHKHFIQSEYGYDDSISPLTMLEFDEGSIHYINMTESTNDISKCAFIINKMINIYGIHTNDICIISEKIEKLHHLEYFMRTISNKEKKFTRTFEKEEYYKELKKKYPNQTLHLKDIRRSYKFNFRGNNGGIKFSTIHSFKGWETSNLVIILYPEEDSQTQTTEKAKWESDLLTYTAITRCRENLLIINFGNIKYDAFFKEHLRQEEIL